MRLLPLGAELFPRAFPAKLAFLGLPRDSALIGPNCCCDLFGFVSRWSFFSYFGVSASFLSFFLWINPRVFAVITPLGFVLDRGPDPPKSVCLFNCCVEFFGRIFFL